MTDTARYILDGLRNEGEGPRSGLFDGAKLSVVHLGVVGQFAQIATQNCEVVFLVYTSYAAQLVHRILVIQMANQGIARVGRYCQDAALVAQLNRQLEQPLLGIVRVNA